ncbi:MAG: ParB/Srx family N-terminal domain-containing protein [Thermodesulfobacteriota bacterium]
MESGETIAGSKGDPVVIPLSEVHEAPGPYTMSFGFDIGPMVRSIERVGVLNRPVVERDGDGNVHIIAGYRRLMALKALQCGEACCTDLTAAGLPFLQKLLLGLYDNLVARGFNDVEKAMILERLLPCVPRAELLSVYMPILGLPCHEPLLETYLLIPRLRVETRQALARKQISLQTIRLLLDMDQDTREVVSDWLLKMRFSINYQREVIDYITDISHRDGLSVRQVLSDEGLMTLLHGETRNQPQRIKAVLDVLRQRRFPTLARAERTFRDRISGLGLPPDAGITHPPGFESGGYRLEVRFSDGEALRETLLEIASLEGLKDLGAPWKKPA